MSKVRVYEVAKQLNMDQKTLVALFQSTNWQRPKVPLVGVEEPEIALHPAAALVLLEAIREASRTTQILVTSHSPELLDDE